MTRDRLIKQYENEIKDYNHLIETKTKSIREIRKNGPDQYLFTIEELANERKILEAQKQRTVQFISDLKYELD